MSDDRESPLLEALEALTDPVRTKLIQDGAVGSGLAGQKTVTVELPPLLTQLEEAIRGTIGIGGSGSLAHQRNMLDADALLRFSQISSQIMDWARMAGASVTKGNPVATLRAWYAKFTAGSHSSEVWHTGMMLGWAEQIKEKLDPPRVWDLPDACPVCNASTWTNPTDEQTYLRPLVVEYKPDGPNVIQDAKALCRSCKTVWGVRQLAFELEQAEETRHAGTVDASNVG
jgi:hypothetical protein